MAGFQFLEIGEAADAIREFILINQASIPEHIRERLVNLTRTGTSPVDLVTGFVRAVWANKDDLPAKPRRLAIAAAELAQAKGYHEQIEGRAARIANALHRDLNDDPPAATEWPVKDDDPHVDGEFAAPVLVDPPAAAQAALDAPAAASDG